MKDEGHIARRPPAGVTRRAATRAIVARAQFRAMRSSQLAAAAGWCVAVGGFVVYLASLDSFKDAYGSVGTGVVLLVSLTLFSLLYYATPDMRVPAPAETVTPRPSPIAARVELVVAPSAALRNVTAQGRMMSVLGARATGMSGREIDLMDWGFAFGVAWAVAREQDPAATEEVVSARAMHATQAVFQAYRGSPGPVLTRLPAPAPNGGSNGSPAASATQPHPDRG
ncbi:MAG: hypothetical protein ACRDLQ_11760 [Solirubrobacterales bacterium]